MIEMQRHKQKKIITVLLLSVLSVLLSACVKSENIALPVAVDYETPPAVESKDLKLGVVSGPYGDMFMDTIEPFLAEKGYSVELVHYDDYVQPNLALAYHEVDMNMFQHYRYLSNFKFEYDLALSAITEIPTASMGIFSSRYDSLKRLDNDITVSVPDDSTNLARALRVLEAAGLVVINSSVDKSKATLHDVSNNPYNMQFTLQKAHNLAKSIDNYDLSVINGNYALSGGLNLSDALYNEVLTDGYINIIAVRTEDLSSQFVTDLIDIIYSEEYRQTVLQNDTYKGFQYPRNFSDTRDWGAKNEHL